jgi:hypothetical protein
VIGITETNNLGQVREEVFRPGNEVCVPGSHPDFFPTEKKVPFRTLPPGIIPKLPPLLPNHLDGVPFTKNTFPK